MESRMKMTRNKVRKEDNNRRMYGKVKQCKEDTGKGRNNKRKDEKINNRKDQSFRLPSIYNVAYSML